MLIKLFSTKNPVFYIAVFFLGIISFELNTIFIQKKAILETNIVDLILFTYQAIILSVLSRKLHFLKDSYFLASILFIILSVPFIPDTKYLLANSLILTGLVFLIKVIEAKNRDNFTLFTMSLLFGIAILLSKNNLVLIPFAIVILLEKNLTLRQILLIITGTFLVFYLFAGIELIITTPEITLETFKKLWLDKTNDFFVFNAKHITYYIIYSLFVAAGIILIMKKFFQSPVYERLGYKIVIWLGGFYTIILLVGGNTLSTVNLLLALSSFVIANYFSKTNSKPALKELMLWLLIGGSAYMIF